ncbi:GTP 3',8-cyclase MoaA [Asticcacaulis aquaticus]|uniref:GTP 3',8-cyclase MoaA n=1 Tax=Asticcacaulis aquaticus TaxID=2984212 RepID=UPI003F61B0B7
MFGKDNGLLTDAFGRAFPYLRLSITEACNFRCTYCLPDGYKKTSSESFLSPQEIIRLASAFSDLGVSKIRLTGGEPTVRSDLATIASAISGLPRITTLAMTTNGYNLKQKARIFADAGINALNVSIDSLNADRFAQITGHDKLHAILEGIEDARRYGITNIKINCVLLKGINDDEWPDFLSFARSQAVSLRFIELMRTGENAEYFARHHYKGEEVEQRLQGEGFWLKPRGDSDGPAKVYIHPDYRGSIGVIAPYSRDFCTTCNRLRVTAKGQLRLCLFGEFGHDLRPLLQHHHQQGELKARIGDLLRSKVATHRLQDGMTGLTPHLASIGG